MRICPHSSNGLSSVIIPIHDLTAYLMELCHEPNLLHIIQDPLLSTIYFYGFVVGY